MRTNPTKRALEKRRTHRGLNDLLSYLIQLDESTLLHKDGALSRHFKYRAPDLDSSTDAELDYHASTWQQALSFLGNGWMVEANVVSFPVQDVLKPCTFPEPVSALLQDERRMQVEDCHYFQTTYYLSVTKRPEEWVASKLRTFALNEAQETNPSAFDEDLKRFNKTLQGFIDYLHRSLKELTPMKGSELTTFLHQSLTGLSHTLKPPHTGAFLDCYVASQDFIGGFEPKIGQHSIKILSLDELPSHSYPGILDALSFFPVSYRWSNRFICLDKPTARTYLKRYERSWSSKAIGILGVIRESLGMPLRLDEDAQMTAEALRLAQTENSAGLVGYGFYNSVLVLMDKSEGRLKQISEAITASIQQLDFRVREESVNAVEAYLGSLPCHGDYNLRKMMVDTHYISHAFPISSVYQGESKAPCPLQGYGNSGPLLLTTTQGSRPFMLNLHVGDVGHTAILGPTGMGKSTLIDVLMASHRQYPGSRIVILDKDASHKIPIQMLGGAYYDLENPTCQFTPLGRVAPDNQAAIDSAMEWLSLCCFDQGVDMTPQRQSLLFEAVMRLANESPSYKNIAHLSLQDPKMREALGALKRGGMQYLLGGTEPAFAGIDILGFDMSTLLSEHTAHRDIRIPVVKALLNELEVLFQDKRPTLLILEEAWAYLKHPLFLNKLTDWFKTLRKKNVAVLFVSQDLADIAKSSAASTLQTSCMTRIYLPNPSATEPEVSKYYEAFGLNSRQIDILKEARPKHEYYYQSPLGHRLFSLELGELAQCFLCVNNKEKQAYFEKLHPNTQQSTHPNNQTDRHSTWVLDWLAHHGLNDWRDFAKEHYTSKDETDNKTDGSHDESIS